jgi:hypothetical protein
MLRPKPNDVGLTVSLHEVKISSTLPYTINPPLAFLYNTSCFTVPCSLLLLSVSIGKENPRWHLGIPKHDVWLNNALCAHYTSGFFELHGDNRQTLVACINNTPSSVCTEFLEQKQQHKNQFHCTNTANSMSDSYIYLEYKRKFCIRNDSGVCIAN